MIVVETPIHGVYELQATPVEDVRGSFMPLFEASTLADAGIETAVAETAISRNARAGTLRGLHFQRAPHTEAKIVWCIKGAVFDVAVDLRPSSPTYARWHATTLSEANRAGLAIPAGCAHGFMSMEDDSEVLYLLSKPYVREWADGLAWNDPQLSIAWPQQPTVMSDRDRELPPFSW